MNAKMMGAVALATALGFSATAQAQKLMGFSPGTSIPLNKLIGMVSPVDGYDGEEITIFNTPFRYTVSGAYYHPGTDYYSANLWGYVQINTGLIPDPAYSGVNININSNLPLGTIGSIGGGLYYYYSYDGAKPIT